MPRPKKSKKPTPRPNVSRIRKNLQDSRQLVAMMGFVLNRSGGKKLKTMLLPLIGDVVRKVEFVERELGFVD